MGITKSMITVSNVRRWVNKPTFINYTCSIYMGKWEGVCTVYIVYIQVCRRENSWKPTHTVLQEESIKRSGRNNSSIIDHYNLAGVGLWI